MINSPISPACMGRRKFSRKPKSRMVVVLVKTIDFCEREELDETSVEVSWRRVIIELNYEE